VGGLVAQCAARRVQRVGGQVGAAVEGEDQEEGFREQEVVRAQEEGGERGAQGRH